ncbi:MAG: ATP-dependent zinc protease [Pseudomonadota bacterium]
MSERSSVRVGGWREWVDLPGLELSGVKAKLDTGARSSALHAWDIEPFERDAQRWVAFNVLPVHRDNGQIRRCESPLVGEKTIKSSTGTRTHRCMIRTTINLGSQSWSIDLTLVDRSDMLFRLLLGRTALRDRVIVDPSLSYLLSGKQPRRDQSK